MLGRWDDRPIDPAYYIEDCQILGDCFITMRQLGMSARDFQDVSHYQQEQELCHMHSKAYKATLEQTLY